MAQTAQIQVWRKRGSRKRPEPRRRGGVAVVDSHVIVPPFSPELRERQLDARGPRTPADQPLAILVRAVVSSPIRDDARLLPGDGGRRPARAALVGLRRP